MTEFEPVEKTPEDAFRLMMAVVSNVVMFMENAYGKDWCDDIGPFCQGIQDEWHAWFKFSHGVIKKSDKPNFHATVACASGCDW